MYLGRGALSHHGRHRDAHRPPGSWRPTGGTEASMPSYWLGAPSDCAPVPGSGFLRASLSQIKRENFSIGRGLEDKNRSPDPTQFYQPITFMNNTMTNLNKKANKQNNPLTALVESLILDRITTFKMVFEIYFYF